MDLSCSFLRFILPIVRSICLIAFLFCVVELNGCPAYLPELEGLHVTGLIDRHFDSSLHSQVPERAVELTEEQKARIAEIFHNAKVKRHWCKFIGDYLVQYEDRGFPAQLRVTGRCFEIQGNFYVSHEDLGAQLAEVLNSRSPGLSTSGSKSNSSK